MNAARRLTFVLLIVGLSLGMSGRVWAQDYWGKDPKDLTREDILKWVEDYRSAKPEFKPGDVLGQKDIEKMKPFIFPGWWPEYNFPELKMEIGERRDNRQRDDFIAATEKYSSQTKIAEDGAWINYVAGQPFPTPLDLKDPMAGYKAVWNFEYRWYNYGRLTDPNHWVWVRRGGNHEGRSAKGYEEYYGGGGTFERTIWSYYRKTYHSHLAQLPQHNYTLPLPNAGIYEYKDYNDFYEPYDIRGIRFSVHRYNDPHRPDDAWAYIPSLRRVRRVSAEVKSDSLLGTDHTLDDFDTFSGRPLEHEWKFHGYKDILAVMNSKYEITHFYGPNGWITEDRYEVRPMAVVEQIPKNPRHPYSSKILFWDAQTWHGPLAMAFDRKGKLWKVWQSNYYWSEDHWERWPEGNKGCQCHQLQSINVVDMQNDRGTIIPLFNPGYPDEDPEEIADFFDLNKLTEGRR